MDVPTESLASLIGQCSYIGSITFSGGEPSMNTRAIEDTLSLCKKRGVGVGSFYIATNGYKLNEAFVLTCLRWYAYCDEKEMCRIDVSNDYYHAVEGSYDTKLLDGLSFVGRKYSEESSFPRSLISEGLAEENGIGERDNNEGDYDSLSEAIEDGEVLYLNCHGEIIVGCDWSYESQITRVACKVDDLTENLA
jgi:hypothetical protein